MSGCDFRIGQKVVCVDASTPLGWHDSDAPVEGNVYTVDGIIPVSPDAWCHGYGKYSLLLKEIRRGKWSKAYYGHQCGYGILRFRPLDEDRYDISIFQEMCAKASKKLVSR